MIGLQAVESLLKSAVPLHYAPQSTSAQPFGGLLRGLVSQTEGLSKEANNAVAGLLNGTGIDVHEAMIATQKSDLAFELALQVRNKAVGAYQQMMGMQF